MAAGDRGLNNGTAARFVKHTSLEANEEIGRILGQRMRVVAGKRRHR
jgi:hypothetical protein